MQLRGCRSCPNNFPWTIWLFLYGQPEGGERPTTPACLSQESSLFPLVQSDYRRRAKRVSFERGFEGGSVEPRCKGIWSKVACVEHEVVVMRRVADRRAGTAVRPQPEGRFSLDVWPTIARAAGKSLDVCWDAVDHPVHPVSPGRSLRIGIVE